MSLGSNQIKQFLNLALICCGLVSCGGSDSSNQTSSELDNTSQNFVTLISPGTENKLIHLRWFPQDTDISYAVKFRRLDRSVIDRFTIEPVGCTSAARSGFTSGICTVDLPMNQPADFEVVIEAENGNALLGDEKRQQEKFTPITRY